MVDGWRFELLNSRDQIMGQLRHVTGGSLSWSIFRTVWGSGELTIDNPDAAINGRTPNWLTDRIRIIHVSGQAETPMGVWLVTLPAQDTITPGVLVRANLGLLDKSQLLNHPTGRWLTYAEGVPIRQAVADILGLAGEGASGIEDTAAELRTSLTFDPDKTWLHIANALLSAAGFSTMHANMHGTFVSGPYLAPGERPVEATYGPEAADLKMLPAWTDEADLSSIPNVVRVTIEGDDTKPGLIGEAINDDPLDPLSTVHRGEISRWESMEDAANQEAADAIAARRLEALMQVTRRATVTHPPDAVQLTDVVRHAGARFSGPVVQRNVTLEHGPVVEDVVRRIYVGRETEELWPSI